MNTKSIRRSHWLPFPFLIALPLMVWVHHLLGLSDALMIQTPPGQREAHTYNLVMVLVGWAAIGFFLFHTVLLWDRGWRYGMGKLIFLAVYWTAILMFL